MSKINKLKIYHNKMDTSKLDCPMKSEISRIITTVVLFR